MQDGAVTLDAVLAAVNSQKPTSRRQLFRYLKRLGIKRVSLRQTKPGLYPTDTAARIVRECFGGRIVSLKQLRAERTKANRARGRRAA